MSNSPFLASLIFAAKSKSTSSGSSYEILILLVLFAGAYFFFIRPRSKRARVQQTSTTNLSIGDEVISAGGILGTVTAIAGDEIVVEVSPGATLTFWRRAINLRTAVKGAPQSVVHDADDESYDDETYDEDETTADESDDQDDPDGGYDPSDGSVGVFTGDDVSPKEHWGDPVEEDGATSADSGETSALNGETNGDIGEADAEPGGEHDERPSGPTGGSSGER